MKQIALLALGLLATLGVEAQTYKFDFTLRKVKVQPHSFSLLRYPMATTTSQS